MKVPLRVDAVAKNGKEYLEIWYGDNKYKLLPSPIKPYFYSKKHLSFPNAITESVEAIALSNFQKRTFYKHSFKTRKALTRCRSDDTFEDNIPFVLRNRIDTPELFYKFPQMELRFLFIDIEQSTSNGIFPTFDDYITSIAWCTNDRKIHCAYLGRGKHSDKKLIELFIEKYQEIDPHIIVVFNKDYDIPTLLYRCQRNKIPTTKLSKSGKKPFFGGKESYNIDGVVIYDVAKSAFEDQTLFGEVENRGLKEVSNYYGFNETRPPLTPQEMQEKIGTLDLAEYNKDDIRRLLILFDVYWTNIQYDADQLGIPLNFSIEMNTTNRGLIMLGDEHRKLGVIADGSNEQRYPEVFHRKGKKAGEPNYQGALVGIILKGKIKEKVALCKRYKDVYKADYSSMYPTTMATFNFSSDTTTLLEYQPYHPKFKMEEHDDYFIYAIPDNIIKKNVILKVLKKQGFQAKLVQQLLDERSTYKKRYKKNGKPIDKAKSVNRKVGANAGIYGNQGSKKHPFGCVPQAIGTTGVDREAMQLLIDILVDHYGEDCPIEADTDGVYFACPKDQFNRESILDAFDKALIKKFKRRVNLSIDFDYYPAGYFYKAKNYALLTEKGKLILHGAGLKASSKNLLSKNLIRELALAKLKKEPIESIKQQYLSLDFPLKWFAMNITLRMSLKKYKNPERSMSSNLATIARDTLGIPPEQGNIYHYIASKGNTYKLYQTARISDINKDYYLDQIKTILEIFDAEPLQKSIDEWLE